MLVWIAFWWVGVFKSIILEHYNFDGKQFLFSLSKPCFVLLSLSRPCFVLYHFAVNYFLLFSRPPHHGNYAVLKIKSGFFISIYFKKFPWPFSSGCCFLIPLKTSGNLCFSDFFRRIRREHWEERVKGRSKFTLRKLENKESSVKVKVKNSFVIRLFFFHWRLLKTVISENFLKKKKNWTKNCVGVN